MQQLAAVADFGMAPALRLYARWNPTLGWSLQSTGWGASCGAAALGSVRTEVWNVEWSPEFHHRHH